MKQKILITTILLLTINLIYSQTKTKDFIQNLNTLDLHSNYMEFSYVDNYPAVDLPVDVSNDWNNSEIKLYDYEGVTNYSFKTTGLKCIGKYNLNTNAVSLLFRSDNNIPEYFVILNVFVNGDNYTPTSFIDVDAELGGGDISFAFEGSKIKLYYGGESDGIACKFSIKDNAEMEMEEKKEFDQDHLEDFFEY